MSRLFVGNLPFNVREESLKEFFTANGFTVISAKVATERDTGRSRGYGFVDLEGETSGKKAIETLNGQQLEGRSLTIDHAKPKK